MGFVRRQEEKVAARLILWHQEQNGLPRLDPATLTRKAAALVEEAHRVARQRGRNVASIMKEMVADILKR